MRDQGKICRQQMKGSLAEHQELQQCRGPKMLIAPDDWKCCFPSQGIPLECYDPEVLEPALSPRFSKYSQIILSLADPAFVFRSQEFAVSCVFMQFHCRRFHCVQGWSCERDKQISSELLTRAPCSTAGWYHQTTHPFKMRQLTGIHRGGSALHHPADHFGWETCCWTWEFNPAFLSQSFTAEPPSKGLEEMCRERARSGVSRTSTGLLKNPQGENNVMVGVIVISYPWYWCHMSETVEEVLEIQKFLLFHGCTKTGLWLLESTKRKKEKVLLSQTVLKGFSASGHWEMCTNIFNQLLFICRRGWL